MNDMWDYLDKDGGQVTPSQSVPCGTSLLPHAPCPMCRAPCLCLLPPAYLPPSVSIRQVAIYDATNATEDVRNRLRQYVARRDKANKVSYLWLEVKLTDEKQISDNIDYMASYSPDYEKMSKEEGPCMPVFCGRLHGWVCM
jgi:hypothetical protein